MYWKKGVEKLLSEKLNTIVKVVSDQPVSGGSINQAKVVSTTAGDFFVKINSAERYPGMFEKEAMGIGLLAAANTIATPDVIGFGKEGTDAFLILKYIDSAPKSVHFWDNFGINLARLHRHSKKHFGLDHDNFIGSLPQQNRQHETWEDFFSAERLEPQVKMAYNAGMLDKQLLTMFDRFYTKLDTIFPKEPPALVHGDLWGGNFMTNENGEAVIIDPAVYYGHREMDLGMSQLFGGFNTRFYEAYHQAYPLEPGWEERLDYCNLYPLMVHVNLFGGGYANSVKTILKKI